MHSLCNLKVKYLFVFIIYFNMLYDKLKIEMLNILLNNMV